MDLMQELMGESLVQLDLTRPSPEHSTKLKKSRVAVVADTN